MSEAVQLALVGLMVSVAGGVLKLLQVLIEVRRSVNGQHTALVAEIEVLKREIRYLRKGGDRDATVPGE